MAEFLYFEKYFLGVVKWRYMSLLGCFE